MSFQLPANPLAYTGNSMGNLLIEGNLPIEAKVIPNMG